MSKRLFKTMVAVLAIAAAAAGPVRGQNASPDVTLDFTTNTWGLPTFGNNHGPESYSNGTYSITLYSPSNGAYRLNSGYLYLGKTDAYLELPEFESAVDSIVVVGNSGASANVKQNIYVGGTAVSTQTMGATGPNTYVIDENYRAAGNIYTLKVESAQNTQITYIKVYYASSGGGSGSETPTPGQNATTHTVTFAEGTEDVGNWSITPEAATIPGVTAGTVVTVKYNGTRRINSIEAMVDGPSLTTPLTIEALTAGNILVNMDANLSTGMKYSVNGGEKTLINTTTTIDVNAGDKVQFYGNGTSTTEYGNFPEVKLQGTAETKVYGNIMSLLDETGYETATAISGNYVFYGLFSNNANLKDASGLLLPAMTLANDCYNNMFHGCTGLTEAPALPAPTLVNGCYYSMFYGCNNLASVTCLATSGINASSSTTYWLQNAGTDQSVTTKTFNAVSSAEWPTSVNGIPEGWTRQDIGAQSTPEPVTLVPTGNTNEWTLTMPADNMLLMVNYAPAVPHTVRFASGNDGWTVTDVDSARSATAPAVLQNVMAGDSLVVTAPATLPGKVKSVKAVKYVAPAATVTTPPAATGAIIEVGSTAALVNAGAASGGTMMYAVTTTNAQPASTADFSASVPTAEGRAAGTYYVWYYAKADAEHSDGEIAGPVSVTVTSTTITVTWNKNDITGSGNSFTKDGVTITAGMIDFMDKNFMDGGTFTTTLGNFTKIEVTAGSVSMLSGTGWSGNNQKKTWTGNASSVSFSGDIVGMGDIGNINIVFTIEPTN